MNYLPHDERDRRAMLDAIGLAENDLFTALPAAGSAAFAALEEDGILEATGALRCPPAAPPPAALGVGPYRIPACVDTLSSRGEFVTAYTPYQPECSQGTLAAIFEFQTRICRLTGLDLSNAGLYDGSTAAVEAVRMALAETGRREVLVARSVAPAVREVLAAHRLDSVITEVPFDRGTGRIADIAPFLSANAACLIVASPNVFGVVEEDLAAAFARAAAAGAVPIQIFHPLAVTMLPTPAASGAEIAVAEGQPLGIPLCGGGPYLGLMAARARFMRRMPGRIVGRTVDADGRESFVLTLQAREQHIRREKATSNICSNQALMALRATIHVAAMGVDGLKREAVRLHERAMRESDGQRVFSGAIFNEWVVKGSDGIPLDYSELGPVAVRGVAS